MQVRTLKKLFSGPACIRLSLRTVGSGWLV
jgi:hypothetical protein